jgi:hypothetical protein
LYAHLRCLFYILNLSMKVNYKNRDVFALTYRNGHGGVTMAVSTDYGEHVWDFVLKNPADTKWYDKLCDNTLLRTDLLHHCFRPLRPGPPKQKAKLSDSLINLIDNSPIEPLTTGQSSGQEWFFLRFLLLTSRPVGDMVKVYTGNEPELQNRVSWGIVKSFLGKILPEQEPELVPADEEEDDAQNGASDTEEAPEGQLEAAPATAVQEDEQNDENGELLEPAAVPDLDCVQPFRVEDLYNDVEKLKTDDAYAGLLLDYVNDDEQTPAHVPLDAATYCHIISQIGASPSNAADATRQLIANKKKLIQWLNAHKALRPYYYSSATVLKRLANQLNADIGISNTATQVRKKIEAFLYLNYDTEPVAVEAVENPETPATTNAASRANLTQKQKILHICLKSGFLPSLEGKARGYAQRGLQLEGPLLQKVLSDSEKGITPIKVKELGSAPLVKMGRNHIPGIGGSVDAVARAVVPRSETESSDSDSSDDPFGEEEEELILIEAKARVTDRTAGKERILQGIARLRAGNNRVRHSSKKKYWIVDADSENFSYFVNDEKEAIQILHHAVVYDTRFVLLVMGNETADILGGIFVRFSRQLKSAWRKVLEDIFTQGLSWAYNDVCPQFDRDFLDPVLSEIKIQNKKDGTLDFRSFQQWVLLWHDVRYTKALPLPPVARIIPYALAMWNCFKGGSDTLTKLLWNADYDPPTREVQAHAVARLLLLATTVVHRLNHIATAKPDLNFYHSLRHYRNAANKRFSFHRFLLALTHVIEGPRSNVIPRSVNERRRGATGRGVVSTRARAAVKQTTFGAASTGSTPKNNAHARMQTVLETQDSILNPKQRNLVERWKGCTGPLLYQVNAKGDQGPKRKCFVCNKQSSWKCFGCHEHYCCVNKVPDSITTDDAQPVPSLLNIKFPGSDDKKKNEFFVRNTCWLFKHQAAFEQAAMHGDTD